MSSTMGRGWAQAMGRERVYIWVDGPARAGKTTLVKRLLESNRSRDLMAARFQETTSVRAPLEDPRGNVETEAYAAAGATNTLLYRFRPRQRDRAGQAFWDTLFIEDYSQGIVFEGKLHPDLHPDLVVYVTRPLAPGDSLLAQGDRVVTRISLRDYLGAMAQAQASEDPAAEEVATEPEGEDEIEIPDEVGRQLARYAREGVPITQRGWLLKDGYSGIAEAAVVAVNVRGEQERPEAERLVQEIRRIREKPDIRKDILGWRGSGRQISLFIANLADRRDRKLQKALARIKRAFVPRWV